MGWLKEIDFRAFSEAVWGTLFLNLLMIVKIILKIRTFSEWDELRPGFAEADLVGYDGGDAHSEFAYTLNLTDVCTG